MSCLYLHNYWVTKRSRRIDGSWSVFLWGMEATSLKHALEIASGKLARWFTIRELENGAWNCHDNESEATYLVEKRDEPPELPKDCSFTVRDQTNRKPTDLKKMPLPGSLF